ncbi:MAG: C10 family peptidase [Bacteroidales bacterium]
MMRQVLRIGLFLILAAGCGRGNYLLGQSGSATEVARKIWMENNPLSLVNGDFKFDRITEKGDLTIFEKFNPASFIILMSLKDGYSLMGYSFDNLFFNADSERAGQLELLDALTTSGRSGPDKSKGTRILTSSVGPLLQTQWGQGRFFNYYCPRDSRGPNGRVYAGCVAVAMGQIVRYYAGFNSINLQYSYHCGFYGQLTARIGPYDWAAMDDAPISVDLEVSDLLSDMGILLNMSYGVSGSTSNSHRALEAFHELGYVGGTLLRRSKFSADSWAEVFYQNISEYKPVMVTGGGHAFVCDGYNLDGLFHFNLGWDGYGDGYYPLAGVMTLPVNEAFTELEPVSWPEPPFSMGMKTADDNNWVTWSYTAGQTPLFSRVFMDDQLFLETSDTLFNIQSLRPGMHKIYVSAVYADGESRWIGPVNVFQPGELLTIRDPQLYSIFQRSLGYGTSENTQFQIYQGELSQIHSLEIDQPVLSLEGLELCNHLKRLVINGFPGSALDAGTLENLRQLRVLEWNGRPMEHPESIGKLSQLTELKIRNTSLETLVFLQSTPKLMKFEYSDASPVEFEVLTHLPLIDELALPRTGLTDASFVSMMTELIQLDLSGNQLTGTGFLAPLNRLIRADLSGNRLKDVLLTDYLQALQRLDVSENNISGIIISAELKALNFLDLSNNKLISPGRFLLYTPALTELDLSHNMLRDMGKQRCPNLEILNVSDNQLIATDWISIQPRLKKLNAEHNRISDLSGLVKNCLFRQLTYLGLDKNPLSKQSFNEWLPLLCGDIDSISKPPSYQPLSPCYVSPANGSRLTVPEVELSWFAEPALQDCVYDIFIMKGDSLEPLLQGLTSSRVLLSQYPSNSFSWVVASRTADSVYYSGVNELRSTPEWAIPFTEGFESYDEGDWLVNESENWLVTGDVKESNHSAMIVASDSRTGMNSMELGGSETAILPMGHLNLPYLSIHFSVLVPQGKHAQVRLQNMNGMYFKLVWDATNTGKFYFNDKFYSTFTVDHQNWMDFEILAHARNNSMFVKAGNQLLINEPCMVPEGVICAQSLEFSSYSEFENADGVGNRFYLDDLKITSSTGISDVSFEPTGPELFRIYPNPFADQLNLTFSQTGDYNISIIDISGKEVYRQKITANANTVNTLELDWLQPGLYSIRINPGYSIPVRIVKSQP